MLSTRIRFLAVATLLALAPQNWTTARDAPSWSFDRLLKDSEVVVVAEAVSNSIVPGTEINDNFGRRVGVDTMFEIHVVFKGKAVPARITVFHYEFSAGNEHTGGVGLVRFNTSGPERAAERQQYILFLKALDNKPTYAPTSGQLDAVEATRALRRVDDTDDDPSLPPATQPAK